MIWEVCEIRDLASLSKDALLPESVTVFGTEYKKGILDKPGLGELRVGVITFISFDR